jgi:hypothetical protein
MTFNPDLIVPGMFAFMTAIVLLLINRSFKLRDENRAERDRAQSIKDEAIVKTLEKIDNNQDIIFTRLHSLELSHARLEGQHDVERKPAYNHERLMATEARDSDDGQI